MGWNLFVRRESMVHCRALARQLGLGLSPSVVRRRAPQPPGMEVRARKLLQAAESVTTMPSLMLHAEFVSCSCPCPESWISSPARRLPLPAGQAAFALPACLPSSAPSLLLSGSPCSPRTDCLHHPPVQQTHERYLISLPES